MGRRVAERAHAGRGGAKGKVQSRHLFGRKGSVARWYCWAVVVVNIWPHDGLSPSPPVDVSVLGQSECLRLWVLLGELHAQGEDSTVARVGPSQAESLAACDETRRTRCGVCLAETWVGTPRLAKAAIRLQ